MRNYDNIYGVNLCLKNGLIGRMYCKRFCEEKVINYRFADNSDTPLVFEFLKKVDNTFPIPLSFKVNLSDLAQKLIEKGYVCLAVDNDAIVGMVGFYANNFDTKVAYISVVSVSNEYQRRGIAKELLCRALDICNENGMKTCVLYTHKTNNGAIAMYKKLGFVMENDAERPDDYKFVKKL